MIYRLRYSSMIGLNFAQNQTRLAVKALHVDYANRGTHHTGTNQSSQWNAKKYPFRSILRVRVGAIFILEVFVVGPLHVINGFFCISSVGKPLSFVWVCDFSCLFWSFLLGSSRSRSLLRILLVLQRCTIHSATTLNQPINIHLNLHQVNSG